jgi:translin
MAGVDEIVSGASERLEIKNEVRDRALVDSRRVVRYAATAIRALHRGEYAAADKDLAAGRAIVLATKDELSNFPDLYWTGYVQDAQKEVAEASIVAAIVQRRGIPAPSDLGVEDAPYLNGMAEAASEMRRYVLDIIRSGSPAQMTEAERVLQLMDGIYTNLITVDFPDAITGGLRRTTDALRAVLERTRGDLTVSLRQAQLERALRERAESL